MFSPSKTVLATILFLLLPASATLAAQEPNEARQATASISGRVTVGGKPVQGVILTAEPVESGEQNVLQRMMEKRQLLKAATDVEGRYRIEGLQPGRYSISPYSPALVAKDARTAGAIKEMVNVTDGEAVEKIDFTLARGGVITGRVVNAEGRPVIGELVTATITGEPTPAAPNPMFAGTPFGGPNFKTDDRGIYRIYGLPPGRYIVGTGQSAETGGGFQLKTRVYKQTFHPGVTEKDKANAVELGQGEEATGIDIKIGLPTGTFKASGRVIDAATGKPIPNFVATYSMLDDNQQYVGMNGLGAVTNARGEFKLENLAAGKYTAYAFLDEESDLYSDLANFEITNGDVTGIVIKVNRGSSLSGVVVVEGTADPAVLSNVSQLQLGVWMIEPTLSAPNISNAQIGADGSFLLRGLQPGKAQIYLNKFFSTSKLAVARVERAGLPVQGGIQIGAGEQIRDIRVILVNATGVVRGHVKLAGDQIPDDVRLTVEVRSGAGQELKRSVAEVDNNGRFAIDDLLPGEYELLVRRHPDDRSGDGDEPLLRQVLSVRSDEPVEVALTITFSEKGKTKKP